MMDDLPPLALPSSCLSASDASQSQLPTTIDGHICNGNPSTSAGSRASTMDCNLPELLARDLELSSAVFASRNMTAGLPSASLATEDSAAVDMKAAAMPYFVQSPAAAAAYHKAIARVGSLGAIDERSSAADTFDHDNHDDDDDDESDLGGLENRPAQPNEREEEGDSVGASSRRSSSVGMESPSIRLREQSIKTAATSLTSGSTSVESAKLVRCEEEHEGIHSDGEIDQPVENKAAQEADDQESTPPPISHAAIPSPDSPHAKEVPERRAFANTLDKDAQSFMSEPCVGQHSHSPSKGKRRMSHQSIDVPLRYSSLGHRVSISDFGTHYSAKCPESPVFSPKALSAPASRCQSMRISSLKGEKRTKIPKRIPIPPPAHPDVVVTDEDEQDLLDIPTERARKASATGRLPPPSPVSPLVNVQTWLETSVAPIRHASDDHAGRVPLSPDVIETLRISTTCFPETMLLTSSLSIETIRNNGRKIKAPTTDHRREPSVSTVQSGKRWGWSRVLSKRSASNPPRTGSSKGLKAAEAALESPSSDSLAPPPWTSLKNVFATSSDYLCDALYAHIVAYNYISSLCARSPPPPRIRDPASLATPPPSPGADDSNEIPRKAASLLGLAEAQTNALMSKSSSRNSVRPSAAGRKSVLALGAGKHPTTQQMAPPQAVGDGAMRALQLGLARCIARLVATLRASVDDSGLRDGQLEELGDLGDVDPLFMRSLCEIVRCCEEAH